MPDTPIGISTPSAWSVPYYLESRPLAYRVPIRLGGFRPHCYVAGASDGSLVVGVQIWSGGSALAVENYIGWRLAGFAALPW